jgi:hypothetical protein
VARLKIAVGMAMTVRIDKAGFLGIMRDMTAAYPAKGAVDLAHSVAAGLGYASYGEIVTAMSPAAPVRYRPEALGEPLGDPVPEPGRRPFDLAYASLMPRPEAEPRVPRLALVLGDEGGVSPVVVFPGLGCASLDQGEAAIEAATDEAMLALVAGQAGMGISFGCGPDSVWHAKFWDGLARPYSTRVLPDGTVSVLVYIGMGNCMLDLGPYLGPHPWPIAQAGGLGAS